MCKWFDEYLFVIDVFRMVISIFPSRVLYIWRKKWNNFTGSFDCFIFRRWIFTHKLFFKHFLRGDKISIIFSLRFFFAFAEINKSFFLNSFCYTLIEWMFGRFYGFWNMDLIFLFSKLHSYNWNIFQQVGSENT